MKTIIITQDKEYSLDGLKLTELKKGDIIQVSDTQFEDIKDRDFVEEYNEIIVEKKAVKKGKAE